MKASSGTNPNTISDINFIHEILKFDFRISWIKLKYKDKKVMRKLNMIILFTRQFPFNGHLHS